MSTTGNPATNRYAAGVHLPIMTSARPQQSPPAILSPSYHCYHGFSPLTASVLLPLSTPLPTRLPGFSPWLLSIRKSFGNLCSKQVLPLHLICFSATGNSLSLKSWQCELWAVGDKERGGAALQQWGPGSDGLKRGLGDREVGPGRGVAGQP